jgi:hypothetical protein
MIASLQILPVFAEYRLIPLGKEEMRLANDTLRTSRWMIPLSSKTS